MVRGPGGSAPPGRSPGHWNEDEIKKTQFAEKLLNVKWAFNAKPDLLLLSPRSALVIEAKLESMEGRDNKGYSQYAVQECIIRLWRSLVPGFKNIGVVRTVLELRPKNGISWAEVAECCDTEDLDIFTRRSLREAAKV